MLPPFGSLVTCPDVEDPLNRWVDRPLAYALVARMYPTAVTPNQITFIALLFGVGAAICWLIGASTTMTAGAVLLWISGVLDGADGMLARARGHATPMGRALDGTADTVVGLMTVLAAGCHLWLRHPALTAGILPVAAVCVAVPIFLYDFYKESYLQMTNPCWDGKPNRVADAEARLADRISMRAGSIARLASRLDLGLSRGQTRLVELLDPFGSRAELRFLVSDETIRIYRRYNRLPMQLWASLSLGPHTYGMVIAALCDRFDMYLWLRMTLGNGLFVMVVLWQRTASRRTRRALRDMGLAPKPR